MATKTTYTKNADGTITSRFDETPDAPNPTTQAPIQPAQPQQTVSPNGTTYTRNADGTITSRFADTSTPQQPTTPAQPQQPAQPITDWKNLNDAQKTNENLAKLVENRYNTKAEMLPDGVSANVGDTRYSWYLDEGKNPIRTNGAKNTNANQQTDAQGRPLYGPNGERYVYGNDGTVRTILPDGSQKAPAGLTFDRNSSWNALDPKDKTIDNLQKLIEARYGTLAEVEGDRVVADIGGKMYQWTLDQNGNPVKTEVPADNTQFNSGEILEQLKANPNLDLSTYDPTQASIAKNNFTKIQNFDGMNSDQLNESLQSGALLVGTEVRNNLNPQQRQIVDMVSTLNMIKGIFLDPLLINENAEKNILANAGPLAKALEDNYLSTAEVDEITITPEMKQMKDNADFWGDEMNRLRTNYEYLEDDIEEELKGQNATASYRDRYMAKEGKALYRALTTAQRNYQMYYGQYNDERERAMQLLNTNIQLYQKAQDRAYEEEQKNKEFQRQIALQNYGMVTDYMNTLENRAYNEDLMQRQREWEKEDAIWNMRTKQEWTTGNLDSEDPTLRDIGVRNTVNSWYEQYPFMVGMEAQEAKIEKVYKRAEGKVAQGMSWGDALREALSEEEQVIRNSDRFKQEMATNNLTNQYKRWEMNNAMNPTTYSGAGYSGYSGYSGGVSNGDVTINYGVSEGSGTNGALRITTADGYGQMCTPTGDASANGVWGGKFVTNQDTGYQCGGFARRRAGLNETPGGNSLAERKKMFDQETPVAGGLVLFTDGYDSKYGHIAYVREVRSDGTMLIEESNIVGPNKYSERVISQNAPGVWGFYNNTPSAKNTYEKIVQQAQQSQSGQNNTSIEKWWDSTMEQAFDNYKQNKKIDEAVLEVYYGGNKGAFLNDYTNYTKTIDDLYSNYRVGDLVGLESIVSTLAPMVYGSGHGLSDKESERIENIVKANPGLELMDYVRSLKQFNIKNENDKELSNRYIEILSQLEEVPNSYYGLSTAINNGNYGQAMSWTMNLIEKQLGDDNGSVDFVNGQNNFNKLIDLIEKRKDDLGLFNGNISKLKQKFKGDTEMQKILTILSMEQADIRRYFGGTAVTETELQALSPYIGADITQVSSNLLTQLKEVQEKVQNNYFTPRKKFLTQDEITSYLNRLTTGNYSPTNTYSRAYGYYTPGTGTSSSTSYNTNSKFAESYYGGKY